MKANDEPRARESRAWSSGVGGKTHQAEGRGDLSDRMWLSPVSKSLVLQHGPLADADSPTLPRMQEYNRGCTGPHVTSTLRVSASFDQVDEQIQTHLRMSGTLAQVQSPGLGRYPGEENGHPLHYPCLQNPMDGGEPW